MVVGEIDAALGAGVAVGGTGVGGNGVGGTAVGGTPVGVTVGGLGASATGVGCFCVPEGSSAGVGPHPIAIIAINTRTINFMVLRRLFTLSPSKFDEPVALTITRNVSKP